MMYEVVAMFEWELTNSATTTVTIYTSSQGNPWVFLISGVGGSYASKFKFLGEREREREREKRLVYVCS